MGSTAPLPLRQPISQRRAWRTIGQSRSSQRYVVGRKAGGDRELLEHMSHWSCSLEKIPDMGIAGCGIATEGRLASQQAAQKAPFGRHERERMHQKAGRARKASVSVGRGARRRAFIWLTARSPDFSLIEEACGKVEALLHVGSHTAATQPRPTTRKHCSRHCDCRHHLRPSRSYLLPAAVGVPDKQFDVVVVAAAAAVTAAVLAIVGIRIVVGELARDGGEPAC